MRTVAAINTPVFSVSRVIEDRRFRGQEGSGKLGGAPDSLDNSD
jgi:hypothetical protein